MDEKVEVPYDDELSELVEQFTQECRAGSDPDIEDYVRRFPKMAKDIRRIFPSLEVLERAGLAAPAGDGPPESAFSSDPIRALVLGRLARELGCDIDDLGEPTSQAVAAVLEELEIAAEEREAALLTHVLPQGDPLGAVLAVRIERALAAGRKAAAEERGDPAPEGSFAVLLLRHREDQAGDETCVGLAVAQIEERLLAARGSHSGSSSFMVLADGASLGILREELANRVGDSPVQVAFLSRPKNGHSGPPAEVEVVPIEHEIDGLESRLGRKLDTALKLGSSLAEDEQAPAEDPLIGTLFHNKYRILRSIGSGGFGAVYEARDERGAGNRVAIKVMRADRARHPALLKAFRAEARRVTRLSHANVVDWKVFDQTEEGVEYFVMELVAGEELDKVLRREKRLPADRVANILLGVLDALRAAHNLSETESILHLDLKPHNVFVIPGRAGRPERVKVIDFGIGQYVGGEDEGAALAKHREDSLVLPSGLLSDMQELPEVEGEPFNPGTITFGHQQSLHVDAGGVRFQRSIACTPEYASPEQTAHVLEKHDIEPLDGRSDIFSLGVMGYLMLTGELPFERCYSRLMMLEQRLEVDARPIAASGVKVPRALARFVERCLVRDRDQRFADAGEAYDALDRIVHPPVSRVVAKVLIPVVALAGLAVFLVSRGQVSERFVPFISSNAFLGPQNLTARFDPADEEDRELIAGAGDWTLVSVDGEPVTGWGVTSEKGALVITGPSEVSGRDRVDVRPQASDSNVTVPPLTLTWLGADSWRVGSPTLGGKELGERSVTPTDIKLEIEVSGPGHDDLDRVTVAVDGHDPLDLTPAKNTDSTRYSRSLGDLELPDSRATLKIVLHDKAGRQEDLSLELPLVVGPPAGSARLVAGPDSDVTCNQIGDVYRLTRTSKPHLLLTAGRPADFSWSIELNDPGKTLSGKGSLTDGLESRISLDELATLGDRLFAGRIQVEFDESPYVLRANPERGRDTVSLSFEYTLDPANAQLLLMRGSELLEFPAEGPLFVQQKELTCVIQRVGATPVRLRTLLSYYRPGEEQSDDPAVSDDLWQVRTDQVSQSVTLPGDGNWMLKLEAVPLNRKREPAGSAESEHEYEICVDDRKPEILFEGLDGTPTFSNLTDLYAQLNVGLRDDQGGQGSPMAELRYTLLNGSGTVVKTDVFASVSQEPFEMHWQLPPLWGSTLNPDGDYELVVTAMDMSGNAADEIRRAFEVALAGPELKLELPMSGGREWARGDEGWRIQVSATDPNGVEEVSVEILDSPGGLILQSIPLKFAQGANPFERVASGNLQFGHEQSQKTVWVQLVGRDTRGNPSKSIPEKRKLGTIDLEKPPRIGVRGLPATSTMSLVNGNETTPYVFGGQGEDSEDRAFKKVALGGWPRWGQILAIKFLPGEIPDFYLDQREVTCGEFLAFVQGGASGYLDPRFWPKGSVRPGEGRRTELELELSTRSPEIAVTDVTWEEASAFAAWIGKRLPSWVEWEYAMRGGASYRVWAGQTADVPEVPRGQETVPASAPLSVRSGLDVTEHTEIRDLSGNVSEWTSSPMSFDGRAHSNRTERKEHFETHRLELLDPSTHQDAGKFWIAGGSFEKEQFDFTAVDLGLRTSRKTHVGFRCAISLDLAQAGRRKGTVETR